MGKVFNHDVVGLLQRLDRFQEELHKSVSSGTSLLNEFDRTRIESYLDAFVSYFNFMVGLPQLDLPESHPREYSVPDENAFANVESEIVNDILRIMGVMREEILNSQSSRNAAGMNKFDEGRVRALTAKLFSYLRDYVDMATPLDLPESSPQAEMSGPGAKGV